MPVTVRSEIAFLDGSSIVIEHPRQAEGDAAAVLTHLRKVLDADKLLVEVQGSLYVIPMRNVKYIEVFPAPEALPTDVVRGGRLTKVPAGPTLST